jgi:acyl dehydratase
VVNPSYAGRTYPPAPPYQVGREKIREFAAATGEHPLHSNPAAARAAGYRDVIAPPTMAVIIAQRCEAQLIQDPDAGIDFSRVVHGDQIFVHHRPIVAGDEVVAVLHVERVRAGTKHSMVTTRSELATTDGEPLCTVTSTIVVRGADG